MNDKKISKLVLPDNKSKLLLHSCCAPCSGDIMKRLLDSNINYTVFFYNPNIHPHEEYMLRKEENMSFAKKYKIPISLINARLTLKSYKRWMRFPKTAKKIFGAFNLCLTSNNETKNYLNKNQVCLM